MQKCNFALQHTPIKTNYIWRYCLFWARLSTFNFKSNKLIGCIRTHITHNIRMHFEFYWISAAIHKQKHTHKFISISNGHPFFNKIQYFTRWYCAVVWLLLVTEFYTMHLLRIGYLFRIERPMINILIGFSWKRGQLSAPKHIIINTSIGNWKTTSVAFRIRFTRARKIFHYGIWFYFPFNILCQTLNGYLLCVLKKRKKKLSFDEFNPVQKTQTQL